MNKNIFQFSFVALCCFLTMLVFTSFKETENGNKKDCDNDLGHKLLHSLNRNVCHISKFNYIPDFYVGKSFWWSENLKDEEHIEYTEITEDNADIFKKRIEELDKTTPIKLEYNEHVFEYIRAYGVLNTDKLRDIMAVSAYYFPIFEEYLSNYGLPIELKYLAAVESALDPNAISVSNAVGLWQFVKNTSDIFDLRVNSYIDERRDVYKSTDAACKYLDYLYRTFNDWQLALAAYNGGPGMVSRAIARSGGKTNYWELRPYFTDQMQNYVPAFIAMTYLMNYHAEHNIFPAEEKIIDFYLYDTLHLHGPLHFEQIENVIGLNIDTIRMLNPMFIADKVPNDGFNYSFVIPRKYLIEFLLSQNEIYVYQRDKKSYLDLKETAGDTIGRVKVYHKVKPGETLNRIAIKYGVTLNNIVAWNNLSENYILRFDDILKIWIKSEK